MDEFILHKHELCMELHTLVDGQKSYFYFKTDGIDYRCRLLDKPFRDSMRDLLDMIERDIGPSLKKEYESWKTASMNAKEKVYEVLKALAKAYASDPSIVRKIADRMRATIQIQEVRDFLSEQNGKSVHVDEIIEILRPDLPKNRGTKFRLISILNKYAKLGERNLYTKRGKIVKTARCMYAFTQV